MNVAVDQGVRLSFPGDRSYLSAVRELVRALLEDAPGGEPFGERDLCEIQLAVQEACVNAIRHGNGDDPAKPVGLRVAVGADAVWFEVTDEGPGFDPRPRPAPDGSNGAVGSGDAPAEGGYGLAIIQRTMDEVRVDAGDGVTTLSFHRRRGERR